VSIKTIQKPMPRRLMSTNRKTPDDAHRLSHFAKILSIFASTKVPILRTETLCG
jgi:hypothetical protein